MENQIIIKKTSGKTVKIVENRRKSLKIVANASRKAFSWPHAQLLFPLQQLRVPLVALLQELSVPHGLPTALGLGAKLQELQVLQLQRDHLAPCERQLELEGPLVLGGLPEQKLQRATGSQAHEKRLEAHGHGLRDLKV